MAGDDIGLQSSCYYSNYPVILYPEYFCCGYPLILDSHPCIICPGILSYQTRTLFVQVPCQISQLCIIFPNTLWYRTHIFFYVVTQSHIAPVYHFPSTLSYLTRVLIVSGYPVISHPCINCLQIPWHIAPVYWLSPGTLSYRTRVLFVSR